MSKPAVGALILAGGESSRMLKDKARLTYDGAMLLQRIASQLENFEELIISAPSDRYFDIGYRVLPDVLNNIGPMGGLHSALSSCSSDYLLTVTCDMPLFKKELADYMCGYISSGYDAYVIKPRGGNMHTLCGIYSKSCLPALEKLIAASNFSMKTFLRRIKVKDIPLEHTVFSDRILLNVNTPAEYKRLSLFGECPPIICICGKKKSGKTTLIENLIPILNSYGVRTATIKHDSHDFQIDAPGSDTFRHKQAGAVGISIYSPTKYMLVEENAGITPAELAMRFSDVDLILMEGGRLSPFPKIEVVRAERSTTPMCMPEELLAICTDTDILMSGVEYFGLNSYKHIALMLADYCGKKPPKKHRKPKTKEPAQD